MAKFFLGDLTNEVFRSVRGGCGRADGQDGTGSKMPVLWRLLVPTLRLARNARRDPTTVREDPLPKSPAASPDSVLRVRGYSDMQAGPGEGTAVDVADGPRGVPCLPTPAIRCR